MDRVRKTRNLQKALLLLLPIALLASSAVILNSLTTAALDENSRGWLTLALRIGLPWLFVLITAFLVHSRSRALQLAVISFDYFLMILLLSRVSLNAVINPSVCVIAASFAILVLRQGADNIATSFWSGHPHMSQLLQAVFGVLLPLAVFVALITVVRQIEAFVLLTFNDSLGRSLLSVIFSPIYLILQTLGFQSVITDIAMLRYQDDMLLNAFINSIILTNFLALPSILIARSFFSGRRLRLFLILLSMCVLLGGTIGPCISLSLVLIFIMLPGTYSMLMICSVLFFICSFYVDAPSLVDTRFLYSPDVNLQSTYILTRQSEIQFLLAMGIVLPIILASLTLFVKKERLMQLGQRRSINKRGISLKDSLSPDLTAIGLLRALGGLSNIIKVEPHHRLLWVRVQDYDRVQHALLSAICSKKPHYNRQHTSFTLDLGELTESVLGRLMRLTEDNDAPPERLDSAEFQIHPMPHIKARQQGAF